MTIARVQLWGKSIGAVSWDESAGLVRFEYDPDFVHSGIEVAPLTMPLAKQIYSFPALPRETFHALPGLLADSLPDDFGNTLINVWLAKQGRSPETFNPVERLCYTGIRGIGALEYLPSQGPFTGKSAAIDVKALVELASKILTKRNSLQVSFDSELSENSLQDILRVGTSAGGHSYEQALRTIRKLGMPMVAIEEQFRRMAFNIIGRNQDDHVKNIAFLMDKSGNWSLSPAFDMTYSHNPLCLSIADPRSDRIGQVL